MVIARRRTAWLCALLLTLPLLSAVAASAGPLAWPATAEGQTNPEDGLAPLAQALLEPSATPASLTPAQRINLLIVAGRPAQAVRDIDALLAALDAPERASRAPRWAPFLLLAEARARTPSGAVATLGPAYTAAFQARVAPLDDLAAVQTHTWLSADLAEATTRLRDALAAQAGKPTVERDAALELVRQAAFVQAYRAADVHAPALVRADETRRFVIDDAVLIPVGEGVTLSAHLARRRTAEPRLPTAMLFTVYTQPARNRSQALQAAARGYAGIVVDARGKRLGTGAPAPYETEGRDAHAAIDWISRQPWSDGRVGMYGGSYSGFAAWAAARYRHPALKTIVPYVAAIPGLGLPMENNVFLSANYAWPFYVANTRLLDDATYDQHERWSQLPDLWYASGRPYREIDQVDGTPNPWLQRWLRHPSYDAYWQDMVPYGAQFADIAIPVLSITGYYDDGQISALQYLKEHYRHRPNADHTLLIGPYDHFGAQSATKAMALRGYAVDPAAQFDTQAITFQWLDHVLRGAPRPTLLADRINYQLMGANQWGHAPSLAAAADAPMTLYLSASPDGDSARHRLSPTRPAAGTFLSQQVDFADRSTRQGAYYPSPIVRDALEPGPGLVFVSAPFAQPVDIVGTFSGLLNVRINKRDVDISVVLHEQLADGRLMQLSYFVGRASHARDMSTRMLLTPGAWTPLPFERTRMTARRTAPGSRLVVVVDVLKDAMHQVNHGTGRDVSDESVADAGEPLRIDWRSDSMIRIPVRSTDAGPATP
ncbi:CocE/NonD family hydrolase [Stenotrophomonas sp. GZD-301]|uniref:CocE/NonD family hydrolase n=1 Tax=Stenotrophomonas sp. GZD-301 TaxID=3404814 RepID=UPI003BB53C92